LSETGVRSSASITFYSIQPECFWVRSTKDHKADEVWRGSSENNAESHNDFNSTPRGAMGNALAVRRDHQRLKWISLSRKRISPQQYPSTGKQMRKQATFGGIFRSGAAMAGN
jgi:hypothetical protein